MLRTRRTEVRVWKGVFAGVICAATAVGQMSPGGGVSTRPPQRAVYDAQHRPITAGGFVDQGPTIFEDITKEAGLATWQHQVGDGKTSLIADSLGSGLALLDYDNDGWLDIYLVNGSTYAAMSGKGEPPHAELFHNNRDGTFTDVTKAAGIGNERWGVGAIAADFDNDGWPDLYVTNLGKNRLYDNNHDGTFTDIAETAGVSLGSWSTGATAGDYDADGRLDLFVPGYTQLTKVQHGMRAGTCRL